MLFGMGDSFDDVLAQVPLWQGTPRQKTLATAGAAQAFFASPGAAGGNDIMAWLRQNQTMVMWIAAGLVGMAMFRGGGGRR